VSRLAVGRMAAAGVMLAPAGGLFVRSPLQLLAVMLVQLSALAVALVTLP